MTKNCCHNLDAYNLPKCPVNGVKGKPIKTITIQSLLHPEALEKLNCQTNYYFCADSNCPIVYFDHQGQKFTINQLKVPVFQKDRRMPVPICYCFNWTRERILQEIKQTGDTQAITSILALVKAGKCSCETRNPQGSCCLANVRDFICQQKRGRLFS